MDCGVVFLILMGILILAALLKARSGSQAPSLAFEPPPEPEPAPRPMPSPPSPVISVPEPPAKPVQQEAYAPGPIQTPPVPTPAQKPSFPPPAPSDYPPPPPPPRREPSAPGPIQTPPVPTPAQKPSCPPPAPLKSSPPPPAPVRSRPRCEGDRFWVPASQTATLGSRAIGGMVYLGQKMSAVSEWAGVEPALIDPRQPVSWGDPDRAGQLLAASPSYSRIEPASRAAFAEWLIRGRSDPGAYVGYVFLYFYGIERRVLVDAKQSDLAREEVDGLLAEVERLRGIYSGSRSFQGYAASFLSVARLLHRPFRIEELEPPLEGRGLEMPLALKIALGAFASTGQPVPPEWALSWTLTSPEISLRTPARRCPEEFRELFRIRYAEAGGLTLKANKARISAQYRPASPRLAGPPRPPLA